VRKIAPAQQRRLLGFATLIGIAGFIAASDGLFELSASAIAVAEASVDRHPVAGMLLFVLLAMTSAMLAFFSSAILVPVGISTWGSTVCFALLWIGWLLGGVVSFGIGRYFGEAVAPRLLGEQRLTNVRALVTRHTTYLHVVLFQAAVPSEIPGYVLGVLRYPFRLYLSALALTELPYALGTVYMGTSFLERRSLLLLTLGLAAMLLSVALYQVYRRRFGREPA
jgi:uncharacterized membrane protein YdjX (TVP38/TMEM64 family)